MKIDVVADVLEALYNNGVIRSSRKMDSRDFMQLAKAAKGSVARQFYYQEKQNDSVYHFVASNLSEKEYDVIEDDRGRVIVKFDYENDKILRLPDGNGIIRITPINKTGKIDYSRNFTKGVAGSEYMYCTPKFLNDTGEIIYIAISDQIRLYGDKPLKVEMLAVIDNDQSDIPEAIVWEILNNVLVFILRVVDKPVDPTDNSNPIAQMIASKLSSPQT